MTGHRVRTAFVSVSLVVLLLAANMSSVAAATKPPAVSPTAGNGLRVSPVRKDDLVINPGSTQTFNITVNNITALDAYFQVIINDFTANSDESGNPAIVFDTSAPVTEHSLKQYVQPIPNFLLRAGEQKSIPVTIKIPKDAKAGGYYGVVRFAPSTAGGKPDKEVSLAGSVGTLVLLRVPGDITSKLNLASFDVQNKRTASSFFTSKKDLNVVVRFQNAGDIQERPFGKVLLMNRSGKTIASYEINNTDQPANVLPDSIRKFSIPLTKLSDFGQYKVQGNFGYGNGGQLLTASSTFYIIPVFLIVLFVAIVALLVFLIFGLPRLIAAYNRRVVDQSRHGRRY